jgi:hypothetical protein
MTILVKECLDEPNLVFGLVQVVQRRKILPTGLHATGPGPRIICLHLISFRAFRRQPDAAKRTLGKERHSNRPPASRLAGFSLAGRRPRKPAPGGVD